MEYIKELWKKEKEEEKNPIIGMWSMNDNIGQFPSLEWIIRGFSIFFLPMK